MPFKTCLYPGCSRLVKAGYCEKHKMREKYCAYPGCSEKVQGKSYCAKHDPNNRYDLHRGSAADRGYGRKWEKVRAAYMSRYPICERCKAILNRVTSAFLVHHVTPLPEGELLDFDNMMSVCRNCHRSLHKLLEFSPENYKKEIARIRTETTRGGV